MKCFIGIDLGSTTTKALVMDAGSKVLGRGITNSRSNYDLATAEAEREAFADTRVNLFRTSLASVILAGLHRAIILRAMSLLSRSGGVRDQFTFTGGVATRPR